MATWAMRQRYDWITARLEAGERFTRGDLVDKFTITTQTASATLNQYREMYPAALRYDGTLKAFVRNDGKSPPKGFTRRERIMLEALERIEAAPAWGAPDSWQTTPCEVRQIARAAIANAMGES